MLRINREELEKFFDQFTKETLDEFDNETAEDNDQAQCNKLSYEIGYLKAISNIKKQILEMENNSVWAGYNGTDEEDREYQSYKYEVKFSKLD